MADTRLEYFYLSNHNDWAPQVVDTILRPAFPHPGHDEVEQYVSPDRTDLQHFGFYANIDPSESHSAQLIGAATLQTGVFGEGTGYVYQFAIRPDVRRSGYGSAFAESLEEHMRTAKLQTVGIHISRVAVLPAQRFWRAQDYTRNFTMASLAGMPNELFYSKWLQGSGL